MKAPGIPGHSTLRKVKLETGEPILIHNISKEYFAEGITIYNNTIIQLTENAHLGFVYNCENFEQLRVFHYPTKGWGITTEGENLIMSDGTATLYFIDPASMELLMI